MQAGQSLPHYTILRQLGQCGMGEDTSTMTIVENWYAQFKDQ